MQHPAVEAFRGGPNLIRVVGHRGARGILPENSMIGFEFLMQTGTPLLEFDVLMTSDMVPVITHNHHLHGAICRGPDKGFLNEEPKVAHLSWAEIQKFDIGWIDGTTAYGQRFPERAQLNNIRIPSLYQLLEAAGQPLFADAKFMLEIKSDPEFAQDIDYRRQLIEIIIGQVRAGGVAERTLLHSFDWGLLAECARQAPDIPISFLTQMPKNTPHQGEDSAHSMSPDFSEREDNIPKMVEAAGGALWCPYIADITPKTAARAKELGLCVAAWTANEPTEIDQMIDLGVDAIVTDYPGRVQRRLSDRGINW